MCAMYSYSYVQYKYIKGNAYKQRNFVVLFVVEFRSPQRNIRWSNFFDVVLRATVAPSRHPLRCRLFVVSFFSLLFALCSLVQCGVNLIRREYNCTPHNRVCDARMKSFCNVPTPLFFIRGTMVFITSSLLFVVV